MNASWLVLESAVCLEVSGKDARRYLHNRLSNDIRSLSPGGSVSAAALTAQGRVEAVFEVVCRDEQRFLLVADGGEPAVIAAALKRFVVADRVLIKDLSSKVIVVHIGREPQQVLAVKELPVESYICALPCSRIESVGTHLVVHAECGASVCELLRGEFGSSCTPEEYAQKRWQAGVPVYPTELNDQVILTECGMLHALSFNKGCYVGQEVIERSDAIGRLPRKLERIILAQPVVVEEGEVVNQENSISLGKVVSSIANPVTGETYLFALLKSGKYTRGARISCAGVEGTIV